MSTDPRGGGPAHGPSKGRIMLVHLYPREMSIYGDLGNTRALATRMRRHGYDVDVHDHHPGADFPAGAHLVVGGGGQDSGQVRVTSDLERTGPMLRSLARDDVPMLMVCGMYQLFGHDFTTASGERLPGLGILDVTTKGNDKRMIGPVLLRSVHGEIVGYENHSGSTVLDAGQQPLGIVVHGHGNNGKDGTEGVIAHRVHGTYLHGPVLPANPALADALIRFAVQRALTSEFEPAELDDTYADAARDAQVRRLMRAAARKARGAR